MNIPDEAVEAAARAMLDKMYDDKTLRVDDEDRDIMRAALEAAAPYMLADDRAEVWDDGHEQGFWNGRLSHEEPEMWEYDGPHEVAMGSLIQRGMEAICVCGWNPDNHLGFILADHIRDMTSEV